MGISNDITQAESSGRANVPAKTSSALGLGQFLKGTWLEMMRRYHPELAQGRSDAEILELRKNPLYSQEMTRKYAEENEAKLRQAGIWSSIGGASGPAGYGGRNGVDAPGGIPGLLMQIGAFDLSHPDDPPAGGLRRLLQDYMRNNPDGGSAP